MIRCLILYGTVSDLCCVGAVLVTNGGIIVQGRGAGFCHVPHGPPGSHAVPGYKG